MKAQIVSLFFIGLTLAPMCFANPSMLAENVGQMVLMGFKGTKPEDPQVQRIAQAIGAKKLGGVILFAHNIESPSQLKTLTDFLHQANTGPLPLFVAVDQEGGQVMRLKASHGFTGFPSHEKVARTFPLEQAYFLYYEMAAELKHFGINLNLAPVVDVKINAQSPAIGARERSFSRYPENVFNYAREFIRAHREVGVLTTLKHWPGHGSAAADSHLGMVDVTNTWVEQESIPYRNLTYSGLVDAIMTAHVFNRAVDADKPATLSIPFLQGKLRGELGFNGVVFTDCLQMGAITALVGNNTEDAALQAITAGADIMVLSNFHVDDLDFADRLVRKIEQSEDAKAAVLVSSRRIEKLKQRIVRQERDEL